MLDEFNEIQANDLYHRVSKKIRKGIFRFRFRSPFSNKVPCDNILDYPEDYLDESADDWYGYNPN
jgi:hypothetical protein